MKIAVFLPNWIGDAVMATPALRALRDEFSSAEITAIQKPYVAEVLNGLDLVDHSLDWVSEKSLKTQLQFLRQLRQERFDLAVLFPNSFRSACLSFLAGIPRRVGIQRDGRGWLLTDVLPAKDRSTPYPAMDEYLRIAAHLIGVESPDSKAGSGLSRKMELAVTEADRQRWVSFWNKQSAEFKRHPLICLNPGGAFGAAKHWPVAHFAKLAQRLAGELQRSVLVVCGPAEKEEAVQIVEQANHPLVTSLADEPLHLGLTKAAIQQAELLVTTDSGPRHFAAPFDVPVVTLFGPTHIMWSETFYERGQHLQLAMDCGPCQQRVCPLGHHRCMKDLSADQVFDTVVSLLGQQRSKVA
ncbi:ADP-heptose--LPS heptosyltransferase 2 [Gimesia panareensis]|uniref:lipopolysaccharide heptosyltransferase II n=1 Tax=Gimesia panareensis TaxID=2527978 RepID=A0A518FQ64_9PLAN|nr:lipopolysaccharide heptosyltransferase II [Gimesia panareensis]QDV18489.1 ADP-heptose--LPS heptosyltransferase 2 [Gimesia panareensis]